MRNKIRAEPKKPSYYNGKIVKQEICELRHSAGLSCRDCIYLKECREKEYKHYENYRT